MRSERERAAVCQAASADGGDRSYQLVVSGRPRRSSSHGGAAEAACGLETSGGGKRGCACATRAGWGRGVRQCGCGRWSELAGASNGERRGLRSLRLRSCCRRV